MQVSSKGSFWKDSPVQNSLCSIYNWGNDLPQSGIKLAELIEAFGYLFLHPDITLKHRKKVKLVTQLIEDARPTKLHELAERVSEKHLLNRYVSYCLVLPVVLAMTTFLPLELEKNPINQNILQYSMDHISKLTTDILAEYFLDIARWLLAEDIKRHEKLYRIKNAPEISDSDYDERVRFLEKVVHLLRRFRGFTTDKVRTSINKLLSSAVLTSIIHLPGEDKLSYHLDLFKAEQKESLPLVTHAESMLSIENAFSDEDIAKFIARTKRFAEMNPEDQLELLCEPKIDGVAFSARYNDGILVTVSTRGNGQRGENITSNVIKIRNFPQKINYPDKSIEVRGEIFIKHSEFEKIRGEFVNQRNAAAGIIRATKQESNYVEFLDYIAYSLVGYDTETQLQKIEALANLGFNTQDQFIVSSDASKINDFYTTMMNTRSLKVYETDGIVYKVNSIHLQTKLGATANHPRWMIAHKFPEEITTTKVTGITIQVGRTGATTPIAELAPVKIGGVTVQRATLHNADEIERLDIREGDLVKIKRAGDVIPKIIGIADNNVRTEHSTKFVFPTHCPVCNSKITRDSAISRCSGGSICYSMIVGRFVHFTSKKAFDIPGLNEKKIEFLVDNGIIAAFCDLFKIQENLKNLGLNLLDFDGWGGKSIDNLLSSIEKRRVISLDKFIYSIGINGIGAINAINIAEYCGSVQSFMEISTKNPEEFTKIHGIATEKISDIKNFFTEERNIIAIQNLLKEIKVQDQEKTDTRTQKEYVMFSGTLSIPRGNAEDVAMKSGFGIRSAISAKIKYLIIGDNPGSKLEKATKLGVEVLTEQQWEDLLQNLQKNTQLT